MKKFFITMALACLVCFVTSCSSNTPADVAQTSIDYLKEQKFDKYVDLIYVKPNAQDSPDELKKEKEQFADMLREKYKQALKAKGGIKDSEVLSEEVADDGETATVVLKVTYGDGSEEENTLKLRKDEEDNWKLDMGK